jgi:uncharacterized protein with HEPN domain
MPMPASYDRELALEVLTQISDAIQKIKKRFDPVDSAEQFTNSEEGMEKLDAICMQLIAVGESLKNLDKITSKRVLAKYPEIDWKKVMGMRDIISHHYFDVDAEAIFDVCENHIDRLGNTIKKMMNDL